MRLTFSPALGEQTILKVAPAASARPAAQSILFRATFDSRESLLQAHADGVRVELWSDIPAGGRSLGEWGSSQFRSLEPKGVPAGGAPTFSLSDEEDELVRDASLHVHFRVPLDYHVGTRFSFTYRLVYPSGKVEWLGEFGRNGEIVIEQGLPGVDLREGWNIAEDGTYRTHAFPGERVLGHLTDPGAWVCWSWKPFSLPTFTRAPEASEGLAMVLSPRSYTREVNVPRPLVFVASHSTTLKITEEGRIVLHSSSPFARVSFSVLEHSRELLDGVTAFDDALAVISCRAHDAQLPVHLIVLPMVDYIGAAEWKGVVLSSLALETVEVLLEYPSANGCLAIVGSSGCELLISPIQNVSAEESTIRLSLLTPHKDVSVKIDVPVAHTLPTPPSPPCSHSATPIAEDSGHQQPRLSLRLHLRPHPYPARRREEAPAPAVSRPPPFARRSPHIIRRYIHMVINVVFWFWSAFVRALATRVVGESVARRISGLIGLALVKTAPPASPKPARPPEAAEKVAATEVVAPAPQYAAGLSPEVLVADMPPRCVFSCTIPFQASGDVVGVLHMNAAVGEPRASLDGRPASLKAVRR
ncbi:hypothetical protein BC628DRAFT_1454357 [Trametes gibbosa]|nr:hypothetical protein BC628DRAFT_1454357 [Trametes gibbosa]